jgi:hypothetical protein
MTIQGLLKKVNNARHLGHFCQAGHLLFDSTAIRGLVTGLSAFLQRLRMRSEPWGKLQAGPYLEIIQPQAPLYNLSFNRWGRYFPWTTGNLVFIAIQNNTKRR